VEPSLDIYLAQKGLPVVPKETVVVPEVEPLSTVREVVVVVAKVEVATTVKVEGRDTATVVVGVRAVVYFQLLAVPEKFRVLPDQPKFVPAVILVEGML